MMEKSKQMYISLSESRFDVPFVLFLLLMEAVLCTVIVTFVSYTEIDWKAYMEQVYLWKDVGERNYVNIRGGTGPLVYPAGFLYLYGWLRDMTERGTDIARAQTIFVVLYVLNTAIVLVIYTVVMRRRTGCMEEQQRRQPQSQHGTETTTTTTTHQQHSRSSIEDANGVWVWRFAMIICCLSKRIHSIFVLRLFNDGPAMLLAHVAILLFMYNQWRVGCVVYSLAVSIKMNVLLFAPGLLLLLLQFPSSLYETILCLTLCATVQLVVGAPFLFVHPQSYLRKAFELDRVFMYKWTVNWKFLSEEVFVSKSLSILLLALHLSVLAFLASQWLRAARQLPSQQMGGGRRAILLNQRLSPDYVCYTLAVSNLVGIVFARTLHYQFYVWYFYMNALLLWITTSFANETTSATTTTTKCHPMMIGRNIVLLAMIEYAFNVYPAMAVSSVILQLAHVLMLVCIRPPPPECIVLFKDATNVLGDPTVVDDKLKTK